jgi:Ni/Co efflux regulator RcnB
MYNGRWNYGPPPAAYYGRRGFSLGYHQWRRGERLPAFYRNRFRQVDYRSHHLRAPPRGYRYVQDDRGEILLIAIASGLIASAILNN